MQCTPSSRSSFDFRMIIVTHFRYCIWKLLKTRSGGDSASKSTSTSCRGSITKTAWVAHIKWFSAPNMQYIYCSFRNPWQITYNYTWLSSRCTHNGVLLEIELKKSISPISRACSNSHYKWQVRLLNGANNRDIRLRLNYQNRTK